MTEFPLSYRGTHSARGLARKAVSVMRAFSDKALKPHKGALVNLASMPLAVAGIACVDTGVFLASTIAGWIVTGLTLLVVERFIADDE